MSTNNKRKTAVKKTTKTSSTKIRLTAPTPPKKPDPTEPVNWAYNCSWSSNNTLLEYFQKLDYATFQTEVAVYKKHGADIEYEDNGSHEYYIDNLRIRNLSLLEVGAMLADLHKELEKALPALPGTFSSSIECDYGLNISTSCKINKPLEVIAAEMEEYNKKYDAYEKALEVYNNPLSVAARAKRVTASQKRDLEKQKKIDKLQKELDKLKKAG